MTLFSLFLAIALGQDTPTEIAKADLPKLAECVVCTAGGAGHAEEKPAAGLMYKGKSYYFCAKGEVAKFKKDPEAFIPPVLPRPMPELSIPDTTGKKWDAEAMKGKIVLVDFWASWCGPCKEMFPVFDKLYAKYKEKGLEILSVSTDQKKADLDKYLKKHSFPNPVLHDTTLTFAKWRVRAIPATFLVKDGQVVEQWVGKIDGDKLEAAVVKHIGQ